MAVKSGLGIVQRQRLALTAGMRQSLALLAMPTRAAVEAITREAEENPFLVVDSAPAGPSAYDFALDTAAARESLSASLGRQIALQRLGPAEEAAALFLVGALREDGYLDMSLAELAVETGATEAALEAGLAALQACEPAGVGARSLAECLELQLADAGIERSLARAAALRLDDFAEERWAKLGRGLGQGQEVLARIARLLRGFPSAPVAAEDGWVDLLVPEIAVEVLPQEKLAVSSLPGALPSLSVMKVARGSLDGETLRALHERARLTVAGVSARRGTLVRIGAYLAEAQRAFFLGRHDTIHPVTRRDAAAALAMHPSTLGRAILGKALLAEARVYPLSMFFSRPIAAADGAVSPFDIQRRIRAMIAEESATAPLADDRIRAQLHIEGVDIARRTVAKYRKCMRVPSSFGRRRRKGSGMDHPQAAGRTE